MPDEVGQEIITIRTAGAVCSSQAADDSATPIKLEVGFAAGGATDVLARFFGNEMASELKTPVIVENLTGASGNIAAMQSPAPRPMATPCWWPASPTTSTRC